MFKSIRNKLLLRRLPEPIRQRVIAISNNCWWHERKQMAIQLIKDIYADHNLNQGNDIDKLLHKTFAVISAICPDVREDLMTKYSMFDYKHEIFRPCSYKQNICVYSSTDQQDQRNRNDSNPIFYDCSSMF